MAGNEPAWLTPEEVIDINYDVVSASKEPHHLMSRPLLESAVARPQQKHAYGEGDIVTLAFLLLAGIAQNHPFQQGNKRTAYLAALIMLQQNGYELDAPENGNELGELIEEMIEGKIGLDDFIEALRPYVQPK